MKVLVTGGCGFLGSHVCEFYARRGDTVIAYDNLTKYELERTGYSVDGARNYNCEFLNEIGVVIVKEDIRSFDTLMDYSSGIDFIVHTAAQPAMTISSEDPVLDFTTNLIGTFNVLSLAKELRIPMVSCGTIHIYGNRLNESLLESPTRYTRNPSSIDESYPVVKGKLTPLHASKRSAELYIETYIHTYGLRIASFRLTGLYGPRQFGGEDHGWVANFSIRSLFDKQIRIFGTGKQVRDILYATDAAKAFHAFYENGEPGIYNIGGGELCNISILEAIEKFERRLNKQANIAFTKNREADHIWNVHDMSKFKSHYPNWKSKYTLDDIFVELCAAYQ